MIILSFNVENEIGYTDYQNNLENEKLISDELKQNISNQFNRFNIGYNYLNDYVDYNINFDFYRWFIYKFDEEMINIEDIIGYNRR